jgi:hypothetical protein
MALGEPRASLSPYLPLTGARIVVGEISDDAQRADTDDRVIDVLREFLP